MKKEALQRLISTVSLCATVFVSFEICFAQDAMELVKKIQFPNVQGAQNRFFHEKNNINFRGQTATSGSNLLRSLTENWTNNAWAPFFQYTYTHNADGTEKEYLAQERTDSGWSNSSKAIFSYDSNRRKTQSVTQTWGNGTWINSSKESFAYDLGGRETEDLSETWSGIGWINYYKNTYLYGSTGTDSEALGQVWSSHGWVNNARDSYTYDSSSRTIQKLSQDWAESVWVNLYKSTLMLSAEGEVNENIVQVWINNDWLNLSKYALTYYSNSRKEHLLQVWIFIGWLDEFKDAYVYDANGNNTEFILQRWVNTAWDNFYRITNTYGDGQSDGVDDRETRTRSFRLSNNFPNPFNPSTTISYELTNAGYVSLKIFNLLGEEVATLVDGEEYRGRYGVRWDAGNLPGGVYFYRLQSGHYSETKKLILVR